MPPLKKVVIIGAGGHAREIVDVFEAVNAVEPRYEVLGHIVEAGYHAPGEMVGDLPILGDFEWLRGMPGEIVAVCAVGAPELRRRLARRAEQAGVSFCSIVHPSAVVTDRIILGQGVVIAANCVVTNNVTLMDHTHVNVGSTVSHDVVAGPFAYLGPGVHVAGGVEIGEGSCVGIGACVIERRRVGAWSVVGAGSVVISDVPDDSTVVGCPARVVSSRRSGWHEG